MRPQDSLCNAPIHLAGLHNKHGYYRDEHRCRGKGYDDLVEQSVEWSSLQGLVRIESERYQKATGKIEREIRYYITSLSPDAARLNLVIRQHWGIENKLHWVLDVGCSCRGDACEQCARLLESGDFSFNRGENVAWAHADQFIGAKREAIQVPLSSPKQH